MHVYTIRLKSFDSIVQRLSFFHQTLIVDDFEAVHVKLTIEPFGIEVIKVSVVD